MESVLLAIMASLSLLLGTDLRAGAAEASIPKEAQRAAQQLSSVKGQPVVVVWNPETGTPGRIEGALSKPSGHSPEWIAYGFLERAKGLYGLRRVRQDVEVLHVDRGEPDLVRVLVQRRLYGKAVCGDTLTLDIDKSGVLLRAEGTFHSGLERKRLNRPMYPALSAGEAAASAARKAKLVGVEVETEVEACYLPEREGVPLVYSVRLKDPAGTVSRFTVHSMTGRVLETEGQ